jgi:hypothetical protein
MIYLCLKGGLGNQLFQFGAALRLAKLNGHLIKINPKNLQAGGRVHLGEILGGGAFPELATQHDFNESSKKSKVYAIQDTVKGPFIDQPLLDIDIDLEENDVVLDGYFQSGKNMAALSQYIKINKEIFSDSVVTNLSPLPEGSVVAHYRMGDYLNLDVQKNLGLINLSYLDSAIEELWDQKQDLLLFSDGEEILKRYQSRPKIKITVGGDMRIAYKAMLEANILIVPNSTFSLSAAFISEHLTKVCRPLRWSRQYINDDLTLGINKHEIRMSNSFYSFM